MTSFETQDPGDSELEALLRELAPGLLRYCRARAGEPFVAEEIAQESLSALVARWRRGDPPESPRAFVFAIARRRAGRHLRKRRILAPLELLVGARSPEPDPEARTAERLRLQRVRKALSGLPARDREALLLAVAGDLDTAEAAHALGVSQSAFKMRLHRARQRLRGRVSQLRLEVSDESIP